MEEEINGRGTDPEGMSGYGPKEVDFPVVAVGASAGGIEAFAQLLDALSEKPNLAMVYIQHMDPHHTSMLSDIFTNHTAMPLIEVRDGMEIERNHVYVIPPNTDMSIFHRNLILLPREHGAGQHRPIDHFFRSLAEDQQERSIAVILSGTASDGSLGARSVNEHGGIVIAQEPRTAKYDGMPLRAISTGIVDLVLDPVNIAEELMRISSHPYLGRRREEPVETPGAPETYNKLFSKLRSATGVDFSGYKQSTIERRIARRMVLHNMNTLEDYVVFLLRNNSEVKELFQDLLINVTSFFRNPEQFEALQKDVFPGIVKGKSVDKPLRIWVPGCATGEEAYSLVIAFQEFLEAVNMRTGEVPVQIFATDVNQDSIDMARAGEYMENIVADVSPERLSRFFQHNEGSYQIRKHLREMCIFAKHDVTINPPFSRMDLIVCRNLLIYMSEQLQKKVIYAYHYALNPKGYLMLGMSETIGKATDLFRTSDKRNKIYTKKLTSARIPEELYFTGGSWNERGAIHLAPALKSRRHNPAAEADHLLLDRFAPPGVLVDEEFNIVHTRGQTSPYLELPGGQASLNILRMARGNLRYELRVLLQNAKEKGERVHKSGISLDFLKSAGDISVEVIPISSAEEKERHFLVLFEDRVRPMATLAALADRKAPEEAGPDAEALEEDPRVLEIKNLREELDETRKYLQNTMEEHDSVNEELKSANEEIISANEELQSTNEELETAKEELQSSNEELTTLNEELDNRNRELKIINDDLVNILASIDIPIVITKEDLTIRRFTPSAKRIFHLMSSDIGRSVNNIKSKVEISDLQEKVAQVIETLQPVKVETSDEDGNMYELTIRPYRTSENRIEGVVMVFMEFNRLKDFFDLEVTVIANVIELAARASVVIDSKLDIVAANSAYLRRFELSAEDVLGRSLLEVGGGNWDGKALKEGLESMLVPESQLESFEIEQSRKGDIGGYLITCGAIKRIDSSEMFALVTMEELKEGG